ncbi:MAG: right-handed parallel beta-helix repeat-containing protein [Candidatus Latescibacterota bacterium]
MTEGNPGVKIPYFFLLALLCLPMVLIPKHSLARVYYVNASGGSDNGAGLSPDAAWKTLERVNLAFEKRTVQAGDTVAFRRGNTFTGALTAAGSGQPGKPAVIDAYGEGAFPVIDAVSHHYGVSVSGSGLVIGNLRVANARSAAFFLAGGSSHIAVRDCALAGTIYVDTPSGILFGAGTFSGITIRRTSLDGCTESGFRLGAGTRVSDLTIDTVSADSACYGFYAERADLTRLRIVNAAFNHALHSGIRLVRATARDLEILDTGTSDNRVNGVYLNGDFSKVRLAGLTIDSNGGHGLYIDPSSADGITVEKCRITGSKNERNGLALDGRGQNCRITDTIASRNNGDGFNVHGSWKNVVMERCTADENGNDGRGWDGDGYTFHDDSTGRMVKCTARNNKKSAVAHVHQSALDMDRCIFTHDTNGTIPLVYLQGKRFSLTHSVIYSPSQTGGGLLCLDGEIVVRNTIIQGFDTGFENRKATLTADHNVVFGAKTSAWNGAAPGAGSLSADPRFTDPAALDFTLLPGSPCIDAGITAGPDGDFAGIQVPRGKAPDIGAYEYQRR